MIRSADWLRRPVVLGVLTLSTLMFGCGDKDSDDDDDDASSTLDGTWVVACTAEATDGVTDSYSKETLNIASGTATVKLEYFAATDTVCATPQFAFNLIATMTFGNAVTTPAGATEVDTTATKLGFVYHTAEGVTNANTNKTCTFTDWTINVEKDTLTADCDDDGKPDENKPNFDIFKVTGTNLQFGDTEADGVGETAATRPTAFEAKTYVKQ